MPSLSVAVSTYGYLLNGRWIEDGPIMPVYSPYNGEIVANVITATRTHALEAIAGAVEAFEVTRKLPAFERQRVLRSVAVQISSRAEEFARAMSLESGKTIKTARAEVARSV